MAVPSVARSKAPSTFAPAMTAWFGGTEPGPTGVPVGEGALVAGAVGSAVRPFPERGDGALVVEQATSNPATSRSGRGERDAPSRGISRRSGGCWPG
jgi:hypothetical protein